MTDDELSLRRMIAGENAFISGSLREAYTDPSSAPSLYARARALWWGATFQPQDTHNRRSAQFAEVLSILDAPLLGFAAVADDASRFARTAREASRPRSLYNLSGVTSLGSPDFAGYARRIKDVEGMRRAALAVVTLRAEQPADVAAALAFNRLRNPYDDQPLRWDADDRAVVFVGLEPGDRGEHRFYY